MREACPSLLGFGVSVSPQRLEASVPQRVVRGDSYMFCAPLRPVWPSSRLGRFSSAELQGQSLRGVPAPGKADASSLSCCWDPARHGPAGTSAHSRAHQLTCPSPHPSCLHSSHAHGRKHRILYLACGSQPDSACRGLGGDSSDILNASKTRSCDLLPGSRDSLQKKENDAGRKQEEASVILREPGL